MFYSKINSSKSTILRVLLIDDLRINRDCIKEYFKYSNVRLNTVNHLDGAIEFLILHPVDLVIISTHSPLHPEDELLRSMKISVPVIILGANTQIPETKIHSNQTYYLEDPLSKDQLIGAILSSRGLFYQELETPNHTLIAPFLLERKREILELYEALDDDDFEFIRNKGHSLKGSAGAYLLHELTDIARLIEESSLVNDRTTLEKIFEIYDRKLTFLKNHLSLELTSEDESLST